MRRIRIRNVAVFIAAFAVLPYVLLRDPNQKLGEVLTGYRKLDALEDQAQARFVELNGLSPCGPADERLIAAAARKLGLLGGTSEALIVVAPTFSDIRALTLSSSVIQRYSFTGQTAFHGVFPEGDSVSATRLPSIDLAQSELERVNAAVSRNTRYPMGRRESGGKDGVLYIFRSGSGHCASAWFPVQGTLAAHMARLVDELLADQPSRASVGRSIDSIESLESSH